MIRERVHDELGITKETNIGDLSTTSQRGLGKKIIHYDVESKYSLDNINNLDALGWDNIEQRGSAMTPTENADLAQGHVLDKLMADYFLSKRREYKEANDLVKDMASIFESKIDPHFKSS